jgi:hypothetical protein
MVSIHDLFLLLVSGYLRFKVNSLAVQAADGVSAVTWLLI